MKRKIFSLTLVFALMMTLMPVTARALDSHSNVSITIDDGADTAIPGTAQTYTIVVFNAGPDEETDVGVYCMLPSEVLNDLSNPAPNWTVVSTNGGGSAHASSGKALASTSLEKSFMTIVDLPAGASVTFQLTPKIRSSAKGSLSVQASVIGDFATATDTDILTPQADLSVTIDDSKTTLGPGEAAPYKVTVRNSGPSDVVNATLSCPLPTGAKGANWGPNSYNQSGSASPYSGSGALSSNVSLPKDGSYTFWYTVLTVSGAADPLSTTATVTVPDGTTEVDPDNNTATDTDSFGNSSNADLNLSMGFGDQMGNAAGEVTFYAKIDLFTSGNATNVVVSMPLPTGVTLVSATPKQGTYDSSTGLWTVGTLANHGTSELEVKATVDYAASPTVTASLSSLDQTEDNSSNNSASLAVFQRADVAVTASVDHAAPTVGDTVAITVTLTNNGPDTATGIEVDATLPTGLTYQSDTPSRGYYDYDYDRSDEYDDYGVWIPDPLDSGDTATLQLTAKAASSDVQTFHAQATTRLPDPDAANNSSSFTVTPAPATRTVTFDNDGSAYAVKTVQAGESIGSANWPANPTKASYTFAGWYTGANGSGIQFTAVTTVTAATTVYAKWTYNGGSGSGGSGGNNNNSPTGTYVPALNIKTEGDRVTVELSQGPTLLSPAQTSSLIFLNQTKPVTLTGNGYSITFPVGTMQVLPGQTQIDFGVKLNGDSNRGGILSLTDGTEVKLVNFSHSGPLPGQATIRIKVGTQYAGQSMYYYYYNETTGTLDFMQSSVVDGEGYVTVTQSHCSDYVLTSKKLEDKGTQTPEGVSRIFGQDRYQTSVEIAKTYFGDGADTVILTRGDVSADALPAVPLAKQYTAPLLLIPFDSLPEEVLQQIKALRAKKVIIVGGPGAVKAAVESTLKASGLQVERIYGQTHYDTAYEIAKHLGGNTGQAILVNGNKYEDTFPDALSISPWAGYNGVPILYVDSTLAQLPEATAKALNELKVTRTILIGGTAVIPTQLEALVPNPVRYGGTDLYDTNVEVLKTLQPNPLTVFAATGKDFADALAGAAVAAQTNGWLILTGAERGQQGVTTEQEELVRRVKGEVKGFKVFGGATVVPQTTFDVIKTLLGF